MMTQNSAMGEDIRIRSKITGRGMAVMYFLFLVFMLFMGLCLLITVLAQLDQYAQMPVNIAISIAAIFYSFLVSALYFNMIHAYRFAKKPVLVFDKLGITDNTRIFPVGLIRWEEIIELLPCEFATSSGATRRLKKENGLGIRLSDRTNFMSRFGFLTRTMIRLNSWPGYLIIKTDQLDLGDMNILEFIEMLGKTFHKQTGEFRKVGDGK